MFKPYRANDKKASKPYIQHKISEQHDILNSNGKGIINKHSLMACVRHEIDSKKFENTVFYYISRLLPHFYVFNY